MLLGVSVLALAFSNADYAGAAALVMTMLGQ